MKRILLDAHVLLWWLGADPTLPDDAQAAIADQGNAVYVSAATAWEIWVRDARIPLYGVPILPA